jgi:response regulator RpfG family c-di-GMP phosphodiesterase
MQPLAGKTALLVEDDIATRALVARQLRRAGLEVLAVESGEQVLLEAADRYTTFDVFILDVHLPGMSGLDLASLIQARRPGQRIVLVTGDADPRLAREALARGPVNYLLKPFDMGELLGVVRKALDEPGGRTAEVVTKGWLDLVEESYMGSAHARRVGRVALALVEGLQGAAPRLDVSDLLVAAWSHELARSTEDGDPVRIAIASAALLDKLGSAAAVVKAVRHLAERFDGSGGPDGLSGDEIPLISQVVAAADALEHYADVPLAGNASPAEAVDRGLGLLSAQRGTVFRPEVVEAAGRQRQRLIAICADGAAPRGRPREPAAL